MAEPALDDVPAAAPQAPIEPFPPTFYYANGIELFERLAHYGMYVGLALYLTNVVHYDDIAVGGLTSVLPANLAADSDRLQPLHGSVEVTWRHIPSPSHGALRQRGVAGGGLRRPARTNAPPRTVRA